MTLDELSGMLSASPEATLRMKLPDGSFVPAHFHVTEVGHVQKSFIDCGGTVRRSASCMLQAWVAGDVAHRLTAAKLSAILGKAADLFETTAIPVEVEYEQGVISQFPVQEAAVTPAGIVLQLTTKHTACLAPDRCGVKLDVLSGCSTPDCC
jgi:hypothetical protein